MPEPAQLDAKLNALADLEAQITALTEKRNEQRADIQKDFEQANLKQFKTDRATVSYVERKNVKVLDEDRLLADLEKGNVVRYFKVVPEHKELTPDFMKDVKAGAFTHEAVAVEEAQTLQIRFAKPE
jgi:hypothetical protein